MIYLVVEKEGLDNSNPLYSGVECTPGASIDFPTSSPYTRLALGAAPSTRIHVPIYTYINSDFNNTYI